MSDLTTHARRIVQEEREAYCREELGWDSDKASRLLTPPATWIQHAVERALRECPVCSGPDPIAEALNSGDGVYRP